MNINELKQSIFEAVINNGVESSKADIFGDNPMEDKVYTKRININSDYNDMEVVCVSVTNDTPSFDTITNNDSVRVNVKNRNGVWCNLFINEVSKKMLEFIQNNITMNWKPKKGVGKTLYAIDISNYNFDYISPYEIWASDSYCPPITKYSDVMIIANGATKNTTFIIAKKKSDSITNMKKGDTEYKTYKLKKISTINEDKKNVVIIRGNNIILSNDKKELLNIFNGLYKKKEIAARKAIDDYNAGEFNYYSNLVWIEQKLIAQPKYVMESYKNFIKKLKKI